MTAVSKRPYCEKHCGNRQCERDGCTKCAQGATRFCIAHGGGRRCTFPGCDKGARDKFFCAAHGGGKRCKFPGGCGKSAVGGSNFCTAHGGGRRCAVTGCDKSAQSGTKFCVKHGGGKKCQFKGCAKVARGRTLFCAAVSVFACALILSCPTLTSTRLASAWRWRALQARGLQPCCDRKGAAVQNARRWKRKGHVKEIIDLHGCITLHISLTLISKLSHVSNIYVRRDLLKSGVFLHSSF